MLRNLESPKEMAQRSGWPIARIRGLIAAKRLKHIRIGGSIFLPSDAIDEFLSTNMIEPKRGDSA